MDVSRAEILLVHKNAFIDNWIMIHNCLFLQIQVLWWCPISHSVSTYVALILLRYFLAMERSTYMHEIWNAQHRLTWMDILSARQQIVFQPDVRINTKSKNLIRSRVLLTPTSRSDI